MPTEAYDLIVKRAEEALANDAWWALADELVAQFPRLPEGKPSANTGLHAALGEVQDLILASTGKELTAKRLASIRGTALAWPPEERISSVSFKVHSQHRTPSTKAKLATILAAHEMKNRRPNELSIKGARVVKKSKAQGPSTWDEAIKPRVERLLKECSSAEALDILEAIVLEKIRARRKELSS